MKERPEKIRQILAQNIKKRRESLGMTQEKLAESSNLSVQTVNTIEGCRMWVSDKTITRLAKALNIEIFQLFVPYYSYKRELNKSSPSALLELRQNIMGDVEKLNTHIEYRFNEALKQPAQRQGEKETAAPKQDYEKPRRTR